MRRQFNATVILRWACVFFFLLIWQWSGDGIVFGLENGFDMGIQNMEMYAAFNDAVYYGKDLMTGIYGPLGWLYKGVWLPLTGGRQGAIIQLLVLNVLNASLRTFLIFDFWKTGKGSKQGSTLALVASVCVFLAFPLNRGESLLNLFVLTASVLTCRLHMLLAGPDYSKRTAFAYMATIGIVLAIPQLAKFSYFAMALALGIILSSILIYRKFYLGLGVLLGTYLGSTAFLWVLCGEKLQYLFSYFWATLHFTGGYSEVFSVPFSRNEYSDREFLFALVVCGIYACMLIWLFFKSKVQCVSWFVIAPFIFLIFKESFVRTQEFHHIISFRNGLPYVICYLLGVLLTWSAKDSDIPHVVCHFNKSILCVLLVLLLFPQFISERWMPKNQMRSDFRSLSSQNNYDRAVSAALEAAKLPEYDALAADVALFPEKTLGFLSMEQTFFITNGLMDRYKINPIISLWDNVSSTSETMTAEHYSSENAPGVLFYRMEGLDYGYETARMGTILQALLENYHMEKLDSSNYLVLERNKESKHEMLEIGEPNTYSIGDAISIPEADDQYVFMRVNWDLTLLGRLASFVLKVPETSMEIQTQEGTSHQYRFYRALSENGIYISSLADNSWDLAQVFEGATDNDAVQSVTLTGNNLFYQDTFTVSFYGVPKTQAQIEGSQQEFSQIKASFAEALPAGTYEVFWANDYAFSGEQYKKVYLDGRQTELITDIPADGWNTLRIDFPDGIGGEYDITSLQCDGVPCVIEHENNVQVTQTEIGWHIVAGEYDPYIMFCESE